MVKFFNASLDIFFRLIERLTYSKTTLFWGNPFFTWMFRHRAQVECNVKSFKNILVPRTDAIGDIVLFLPFLRELRKNAPQAWITLVVKPATYNLVELCPYVNEILTFDGTADGKLALLRRHYSAFLFAKKHLWKRDFDCALLTRYDVDDTHSTFLAYFSGARYRLGYSEAVSPLKILSNKGYDRLLTKIVQTSSRHELERNLDMLMAIDGAVENGELEIWLSDDDLLFADKILRQHGIMEGDKVIAFGVGASEERRIWPIEMFTELGGMLLNETYSHILIVGSSFDCDKGRSMQNKYGEKVINMASRATLRQTCALLKKCHMFVGNDSGPLHLASAVGTSVVGISCHPQHGMHEHRSAPERFGPRAPLSVALQPPALIPPCAESCASDYAHCIIGVTVGAVKDAIDLLDRQMNQIKQAPCL